MRGPQRAFAVNQLAILTRIGSRFDPLHGVEFGSDPTKWSFDGGGSDPNPGVSGAVFEAPGFDAGFDDFAVMGPVIKQR